MRKAWGNRLTAMMLVRNEANRYLRLVLADLCQYVDDLVILDDASTDGTYELCRSFPRVRVLARERKSGFDNEIYLRQKLWQLTVDTSPDWILALDADEIFEPRMKAEIRPMIDQGSIDWFAFRMYDFWGSYTHYRDDRYWCAHRFHRILLVRYLPGYDYLWREQALHCGRLPANLNLLPGCDSPIRLKHLGWAGPPEERMAKYRAYLRRDPQGEYGIMEQYQSILNPNPHLVPWKGDFR